MLDTLRQLKVDDKVLINDEEYEIKDKATEEGVSQLLLVKDNAPYVLQFPDEGDGDFGMFSLEAHGDHFHTGEGIELKSVKPL